MMHYIIQATIDPVKDREDLLTITRSDLREAEKFYAKATLADAPHFSVRAGVFVYPDGREVEFTDYSANVASMFTQDGDRYWVTFDGGAMNVTSMIKILRKAVQDARAGSE